MTRTILVAAAIPAAVSADSPADYINFIRQVQQDSGVEWEVTIPPEGQSVSPTGVSADGSFFELWSIHKESASEYILDEQFVTSYTPNAAVEILTADPYGPVRRTRVDQPFQVRVTVTGLIEDAVDPETGEEIPAAARIVDYMHSAFLYPEGSHSLATESAPVGTVVEEGFMEVNGTALISFAVSNLTGSDLTRLEGEEVFTASARADFGVSASILDSQRVQIWPIVRGTISGYDPAVKYDTVPPVTVALVDLYPESKTWMQVYHGPPAAEPADPVPVIESYILISDSIPQDRTMVLRELDDYLEKEGLHTLEVLHETPFGIDLVAQGPVIVDRTISLKGSLYVAE